MREPLLNESALQKMKTMSFWFAVIAILAGVIALGIHKDHKEAQDRAERNERHVKFAREQCIKQSGRIVQVNNDEHCLIDGVDVNRWTP